jgi:hypothetical protein
MRTAGLFLVIVFASIACDICAPSGERRCSGASLEECQDGDWKQLSCIDAGTPTTCHAGADGGAEC